VPHPMNFLLRAWDQFWLSRLTKIALPYTLVSPERVHNLYRLACRIEEEKIPGDVIECGVGNGGTAAVLAQMATRSRMQRTVWLFDFSVTELCNPTPQPVPDDAQK